MGNSFLKGIILELSCLLHHKDDLRGKKCILMLQYQAGMFLLSINKLLHLCSMILWGIKFLSQLVMVQIILILLHRGSHWHKCLNYSLTTLLWYCNSKCLDIESIQILISAQTKYYMCQLDTLIQLLSLQGNSSLVYKVLKRHLIVVWMSQLLACSSILRYIFQLALSNLHRNSNNLPCTADTR